MVTNNLTIPAPADLVLAKAENLAGQLVVWSREADIAEALDALERTQALETYLAKKKAKLEEPMLVAERHLERRIGELLGPRPGRGKIEMNDRDHSLIPRERENFRLISEHWSAVEKALPCSRAEAEIPLPPWRRAP